MPDARMATRALSWSPRSGLWALPDQTESSGTRAAGSLGRYGQYPDNFGQRCLGALAARAGHGGVAMLDRPPPLGDVNELDEFE
jgi:hypothetical protein